MPGAPREVNLLEVPPRTPASGDYIKFYDDSEAREVQSTMANFANSTPFTDSYHPGRNLPTGAHSSTFKRMYPITDTGALTTSRTVYASVYLVAGMVVTSATFVSGTTAAGVPTNQFFSLYSSARVKLAVTADDATTAWAANTAKTLTFATPYTVVTTGIHYLGVSVVATTPNSLAGLVCTNAATFGIAPVVAGYDATTATTTPASAPATAVALTASAFIPYAYIS